MKTSKSLQILNFEFLMSLFGEISPKKKTTSPHPPNIIRITVNLKFGPVKNKIK
jgi:hypothetical protein